MVRELVPTLLLLVGVVLVANPLWTFPHAGEASFTYRAERIEYAEGYLRAGGNLEKLDCYGSSSQEPGCLLWAQIAQQGPVTVNHSGIDRFNYGTRYVVVEEDPDGWNFYERVIERGDREVTLSLEPVAPAEILSNVSVEYDDLSEPGQEAIRTGNVTVWSDSLPDEGAVVQYQGDYYTIRYAGYRPPERSAGQARLFQGVLALAGLGVALSGQRRRLTWP